MNLFSVTLTDATNQDDAYEWCLVKFGKSIHGTWSRGLGNRWAFNNNSDAYWFWIVWR